MATVTERLALLISADVKGAVQGLNEVGKASKQHLGESEKRIDKVGRTFSKVGTGMLALGGAAAAGLYQTVEAASDLEQAVGGTEAVFKDASGVIDDYAKDAADAAGLSERAFREATTGIGGNLKRMGFSVEEAAEQSANLTQVAADLAATYGGTTAEAVQALGAAFRGEADPAERFNLNLKASTINAKAVELGLAASTTAVDENARAQALLAAITEQSADAQGQFAREADSAAGSAQIASAKFENARASLGESLAPVMADAAGLAADLFDKFNALNESTDGMASKLAIGATGFTLIGGAALTVAGKIIDLNRSLRDADGNLTRTGRTASRLGKVLGTLAVLGLANELKNWAAGLGEVSTEIEKVLGLKGQQQAEEFKEKIREVTDETGLFEISWKALGRDISNTFGEGFDPAKEARDYFDELIDSSLSAATAFRDAAAADSEFQAELDQHGLTQEYLNQRLEEGVSAQANLATSAQETSDIVADAAGETEDATSAWEEYSTGVEDAIDPLEMLEDAIKDVNDALKAQFDPLFGMTDALLDNQEAQIAVTDANRAAKKAQDDLNGAIYLYGKNSPEATEAAHNLERAQRDVDDANRGAYRSAVDVTTAANELAGQMRAGNIDIEAAENQIRLWAEQGLITEEQARQMKDELNLAALAAQNLDSQDVSIQVSADFSRFNKAIADFYANPTSFVGVGDVGGPLIVPQFNKAEGGWIDAPRGKPVFGIAHGGEYVLTADEADAMRRGGSTSLGQAGPTVVIQQMHVNNEPTEQSIVRELRRQQHLLGAG